MSNSILTKKIAIGTAQFGMKYGVKNNSGAISVREIRKIIKYVKLKGLNTIDTSINYGNAESKLGKNNINKFRSNH